MSEPAPTLSLRGLGKTFPPAVQALAGASLELRAGEVHALIGENGAGKSTLSRIVAGIEQPSAGDMLLRGRGYAPASRRSAEESGVRMVMQELSLVPTLTVAENIYLERLPRRYGLIDRTRLRCEASALLADLGLDAIHPATPVGALGIGQQQMVEIARGLSAKCEVLILDEPTAALTVVETDSLFAQIARLAANGVAILYISHRLEEIVRIAQRITVLRDGTVVASQPAGQVTIPEMVRMMVGRAVPTTGLRSTKATEAVALRVHNLTTRSGARNVSFDLRRGEILGLAGLMGSGRTETVRAIFGADPIVSGSLEIDGRPARIRSPHDAVRAGMALVTEDRKAQGLLLPASIRHNITLASMRAFRAPGGFISRNREQERAEAMSRQLNVRASSIEQPASQLSGGNQQKVVIAKWLLRDPQILIFDEPTRGIDMGARFEIYQLLVSLAERGKAILVVSSELPELLLLCNRIAVLSRGKLARIFDDAEFDQDAIMRAALSEFAASTRATS